MYSMCQTDDPWVVLTPGRTGKGADGLQGAAVAMPTYCLTKDIHKEIIHEHSVTEPAFEKYLFILLDSISKNNKQP